MGQRHLVFIRRIAQLYAPVKGADHNIRPLVLQRLDIGFDLILTVKMIIQLINAGQTHRDILIFYLIERDVIVAKRRYPRPLQIFHRIIVSPVSVVVAVVVRQIRRFHRAVCQDFRVGGVSLKGKLLILPGIPVGQGTFQVNAGQIVRREGTAYILQKPGSPVFIIGRVKAGVIGKIFIRPENTVAGKAHQDTGRLRPCRRRRRHRGRTAGCPHTFRSCSRRIR